MVAAFVTLAAVSAALAVHGIGHVAARAASLAAAGRPLAPGPLLAALNGADAVLAALALLALATLAALERRRAVSRFLATATPVQMLVVLVAALAWQAQYCAYPGVLLGGDSGSHIARFFEVAHAFAAGQLPLWTNFQYLGSPLLIFTGPLLYVVGGALTLLVGGAVLAAKLLLAASQIGTGLLCYALLRRLGMGRGAAFTGAIGFAGSFAYLHLFIYRGVFPQALTIFFVVLLFWAAEGIMRRARVHAADWLAAALATGGLILNHQPHALFTAAYLALFGAGSLALGRWRPGRLPALASAGVAGVVIGAAAVLPILREADWVMIEPASALFRLHLPTPARLLHLVLWRDTRTTWGMDYWAYLGIALVVLAVLGAARALRGSLGAERRALVLALLPCLALSLVLWNPVVRDVMFVLLFVAVLAALGTESLAGAWQGRAQLIAAAAVLLDVSSTAIQPVARTDKQFLVAAGQYLAQAEPPSRSIEITLASDGGIAADIGPGAGPPSYAAMPQRVAGYHNMAATRAHNFIVTAAKDAERDLRANGRLSAATQTLLDVLNVGRIVCLGSFRTGCPGNFADVRPEGPLGEALPLPAASPVLFAPALTRLAPPPGLDKPMLWAEAFGPGADPDTADRIARIRGFEDRYLALARIDAARHVAAALPVRTLPAGAAEAAEAPDWHAELLDYRVGLQSVRIAVHSSAPAYVQLAHPWYPATELRLNGAAVPMLRGALDLIVLKLPAGESRIELRPTMTPVERIALAISAFGLLATLLAGGLMAAAERRR